MTTFDPLAFKCQFPLFSHPENQQLVYLDNAATTQKPAVVISAISDFYSRINANANRSSHRLGRTVTEMINRTRVKTAEFIGASKKEQIIFTTGATAGINIIAHHCAQMLQQGDEILLSIHEHHANLVPWQEVSKNTGATVRFIQNLQEDWSACVNDKTRLISITAASNTLGCKSYLSCLQSIKQRYPDIWIVIDGSQLVAHGKLNVELLACDFFVFSSHKCYGPSGLGVLYGRYNYLNTLSPLLKGGEMIERVELEQSHYTKAPARLEAGTAPLAAIAGFEACLDFWARQNYLQMHRYEKQLSAYLHDALKNVLADNPDYVLLSQAENNIGIAALYHKNKSINDMAYWLDQHDIAVRVGDHCAQPMWRSLGVKSALRISLAAYNTFADIDRLIEVIQAFLSIKIQQYNSATTIKNNPSQWQAEVENLLQIKNWQQRFKKIMQLAKQVQIEKSIRSPENIIKGCESSLWLSVSEEEDRFYFEVDSDSAVIKGLAMVMISRLNGLSAEEILGFDQKHLLTELGFEKHISESRVSGLSALVETIKQRCQI